MEWKIGPSGLARGIFLSRGRRQRLESVPVLQAILIVVVAFVGALAFWIASPHNTD